MMRYYKKFRSLFSAVLISLMLITAVAAVDINPEQIPFPEEMKGMTDAVVYAASFNADGQMVSVKELQEGEALAVADADLRYLYFCVDKASYEPKMDALEYLSDLEVEPVGPFAYNGAPQEPEFEVSYRGQTLKKGTDYVVMFENNTDAGDAIATIKGIGAYFGTKQVSFEILPVELHLMGVQIANKEYDGTTEAEIAKVVFDPKDVVKDTDYEAVAEFEDANAGDGKDVAVTVMLTEQGRKNFILGANGVGSGVGWANITPKAVEEPTVQGIYAYSGSEQTVKLNGFENFMTIVSGDKATDAGTYTVEIALDGNHKWAEGADGRIQWTIGKSDLAVTAPTAKTDLVYNGEEQALITAGTAQGGTMLYSLAENGTYTEAIPVGTDAGEYTVWYYVQGGSNHDDSAKASVTVTIAKAAPATTAPVAAKDLLYTGEALELILAGTSQDGMWQYKLEGGTYSADLPTAVDAGTYTVFYQLTGDSNHTDLAEASMTVTVGKADSAVTDAPAAKDALCYTGEALELVTAGAAQGGTLVYSLTEDGAYTAEIPTAILAGDYTVYYKVEGNANYEGCAGGKISVTIAKAEQEIAVTAADVTYSGEAYDQSDITVTGAQGDVTCGWYTDAACENAIAGGIIDAGTYYVKVSVTETENYQAASRIEAFTVAPKAVSIQSVAVADKTYDGTTDGATVTEVVFAGLIGTDTVEYTVVGAQYDDKNAGDAVKVTGSVALADSVTNYVLPEAAFETTGVIRKKAITVTMDDKSKVYGAENPAFTWKITEGALVTGDEENVITVAGYCAATTVTGVGSADITGSADARNYAVTVLPGTLTIEAKNLSDVTVEVLGEYEYTGRRVDRPTVRVTDNGKLLESGYTYTVTNNINAGEAVVTVTAMSGGNYTGEQRVTFTIAPKAVTIQAVTVADKTYDGTIGGAKVTGVTFEGLVGSDTVAYSVTDALYADANAGDAVKVTGTVALADSVKNYVLNNGAFETTGVIARKAITVTLDDQSKTYGNENPVITWQIADGMLVNGDEKAVIAVDASYEAGKTTNVGAAAITGTAVAANYEVTVLPGVLTVNAKSVAGLTVEEIADQSYTGSEVRPSVKVVDGTVELEEGTDYTVAYTDNTNAGTATVIVTGLGNYDAQTSRTVQFRILSNDIGEMAVSGIADSYTYTGEEICPEITVGSLNAATDYDVAYENNIHAGTAKIIITGKGNYTGKIEKTFKINKAASAITEAPAAVTGLTYTGEAQELVAAGTAVGGTMVYSLTEAGNYAESIPVGTNAAVYTVWYYVKGDANHSDSEKASVSLSVAEAGQDINVTIASAVYDGEAFDQAKVTVTGAQGALTYAYYSDAACESAITAPVDAGTYYLKVSAAATENYNAAEQVKAFVIAPKTVAITGAAVAAKEYDGEINDAVITEVTFDGAELVVGEDYTVSGVYATADSGTVDVTVTVVLLNRNYALAESTFVTTGVIEKLDNVLLVIAANDATYTGVAYDAANIETDDELSGEVVYSYYADEACTRQVTPINVGTYYVKGVIAGSDNVNDAVAVDSFEITKAPLTVKANAHSVTYGDEPANGGYSCEGLVNGEQADAVLNGAVVYTYTYEKFGNAGTYAITPAGLTADNYAVTFEDGVLTVEPAEVILRWSSNGNSGTQYDGREKSWTAKATLLRKTDVVTVVLENETQTNVGDYETRAVRLEGASADNYKLPENAALLWWIDPAQLTIASVTVADKEYNGLTEDAPVTVILSGAVNGEQLVEGIDYTVSGVYETADAGEAVAVTVTVTLQDTAPANNYVLEDNVRNTTGKVTKTTTALTLSAGDAEYTGQPYDAANKLTKESNVADEVTYTYYKDGVKLDGVPTDAGSYTVKGIIAENTNTSAAEAQADFTITKKALTVTANEHTITYGDAPAGNGVSYDGFVPGENENVLSGELAYDYTYEQYGDVGVYAITPKGLTSGNYAITFVSGELKVEQKEIGLDWAGHTDLVYGDPVNVTATATGMVNGDGIGVTVAGGQNANAGKHTAKAAGLTGEKAAHYKLPPQVSMDYTVAKADMANVTVSEIADVIYNGQQQKPAVTVTFNGVELAEADYEIAYGDNINEGEGTVTITGKGNFDEQTSKTVKFNITKASLTVAADSKSITYGDAAPEYTVTYSGFVNGEDETVLGGALAYDSAYTQYGNVGEYTVTPMGLTSGNYEITFAPGALTVNPLTVELAWSNTEFTYDGSPKAVTAEVGNKVGEDDVTVVMEDNTQTDVGAYIAKATGLAGAKAANYAFTAESKGYEIKAAEITAEMVTVTLPEGGYTYTGSAAEPAVVVKDGELEKGTDYTVAYADNTNAGTATVTVTGKGNYTGTVVKSFTIAPKTLTEEMVADIADVTYNGQKQQPDVTVTDGEKTLIQDTDYAVEQVANADIVGKYDVTITGIGNYTGKFTVENGFEITAKSILESDIIVEITGIPEEGFVYDGTEHTATVVVKYTTGEELAVTYDYGVVYQNNTEVGTATLTISGVKNYTGEVTHFFKITAARADVETAPTPVEDLVYNTKEQDLIIRGTAIGGTMVYSLDENGTYYTNIPTGVDAKTYTVWYYVQGDSNHEDSGKASVEVIIAKAAPAVTAPAAKTGLTYTGEAQELIIAGSSEHGQWQYKLGEGDYGVALPKTIAAGEYTISYKFLGDNNHVDIAEASMTVIVARKAVAEPAVQGAYTYNGNVQTAELTDVEGVQSVTGNQQTNAGTHSILITLDSNHQWAEGSDGSVAWIIAKAQAEITLSKDTISAVYGDTIDLNIATANFGTVTCNKQVADLANVGEYTVTYTVESTENYEGATKNITVIVAPKAVAEPSVKGTYTYTGQEQEVQLDGFAADFMTIVGENKATNAGEYTVEIELDGNHQWADSADGEIAWEIIKAKAEITVDTTPISVTYGEPVSIPAAITTFGEVICDKSAGDLVNAGSYTITYTVEGTDNFDGDSETVSVTVNQKTVAEPTVKGDYTYTGQEQKVQLDGFDSGFMTIISGNTATDAGEYTVKIELDSNHNWAADSDGSVEWSIEMATPAVTAPTAKDGLIYNGNAQALVNAGEASGGTLLYKLDNGEWNEAIPAVADAGTYTVWYYVKGADNYNDSVPASVSVTVNPKEITIAAVTVAPKSYDGTSVANVTAVTFAGLAEGEILTLGEDFTVSAAYDSANAGTVNVTGTVTLKAENYVLVNGVFETTGTIAKKQLDVSGMSWNVPENVVYKNQEYKAELNGTLPEGVAFALSGERGTNAGNYTAKAVFSLKDGYDEANYEIVGEKELTAAWEIAKADPEYTAPSNLTATYGDTLVDVELPEGFKWEDDLDTSVGDAGTNTFTATFTPEDKVNYNTVEVKVSVTVGKANPDVTAPTGLTATYGQTLEDVALPEGFEWKDNSLSVGNAGDNIFTAIYTPKDTANYNTADVEITVTVNRDKEDKFAVAFPHTEDYLYRVGNKNTVARSSLFNEIDGVTIGDVSITFTKKAGTASGSYNASKDTIQFSGNGVVEVTISETYAKPVTLLLEVVDATNVTAYSGLQKTSNSVLLKDITMPVDMDGYITLQNATLYGNGFTVTVPQTAKTSATTFLGWITLNNSNLDNVRIEGPVYPAQYVFHLDAVDSSDRSKVNYFYNSVAIKGGNCTISNSYISGCRTALYIGTGENIRIENTTIDGGSYANVEIAGGVAVTLKDLTTVQTPKADSYGKGNTIMGIGVLLSGTASQTVDLYLEGELNQYNWMSESEAEKYIPSKYTTAFETFYAQSKYQKYWYYKPNSSEKYINYALVYISESAWDQAKTHDTSTMKDEYGNQAVDLTAMLGGLRANANNGALTDALYNGPEAYESEGFNPVAPVFAFDNSANHDADDANDTSDPYCVYESGRLKIGLVEDTKAIGLSGITVTESGEEVDYSVYLNGTAVVGTDVVISTADGATQELKITAYGSTGYDKNGEPKSGTIEYTWIIPLQVAELSYPAPVWNMGGTYKFDTTNCVYTYKATSKGYVEAVPIYEGIKVNYYDNSGKLVQKDFSGTTAVPTADGTAAYKYTLSDGSTLNLKLTASGWKNSPTAFYLTTYSSKVYVYAAGVDADETCRAKTTNQNFDIKISYTFTDPFGQSVGPQTVQWYNTAANNGNVKTVQWKTFDSTNGQSGSCVTPDTLVTLADGTQKRIDELEYTDEVLVWDFVKGEYTGATASILVNHGEGLVNVLALNFANGSTVKTIDGHCFFDVEENKFVCLKAENVADYVGHRFVMQDSDGYAETTLDSYSVVEEYTEIWSLLTAEHFNCIMEGMFSLTNAEVEGPEDYVMPFVVGEGMKYDAETMAEDIETYGLYEYEDFEEYLTYEQFAALNLPIFKVSVGKGYITYNEILALLGIHVDHVNGIEETIEQPVPVAEYTIYFDTDGGSEIEPITLAYGAQVTMPEDPVKEGYTFLGWDEDIPEVMPEENLVFTALWQVVETQPEAPVEGEQQPPVESEQQPPVEGEQQPPVEGEEQPPVEGEQQPPVEGEQQPPVEGEEQPPVEGEQQPPVEGEEQPPVEGEEQPPVEGEQQPPVEGEEQPPVEGEQQPPVEGEEQPPVEGEQQPPVEGEEQPPVEEEAAEPAVDGTPEVTE